MPTASNTAPTTISANDPSTTGEPHIEVNKDARNPTRTSTSPTRRSQIMPLPSSTQPSSPHRLLRPPRLPNQIPHNLLPHPPAAEPNCSTSATAPSDRIAPQDRGSEDADPTHLPKLNKRLR